MLDEDVHRLPTTGSLLALLTHSTRATDEEARRSRQKQDGFATGRQPGDAYAASPADWS